MTPADVPSACALLNAYLARTKLAPVFSEADFAHWLLPREGVVDSFVVANEGGKVTDLCRWVGGLGGVDGWIESFEGVVVVAYLTFT